jgi:hypothetical protein
MTDQHRATPEQWERITDPGGAPSWACILELRARVEALEAAPAFRVLETGERIQMNIVQDKLDRLIALDAADPTPDPAMAELRAASTEARPAGLVEQVSKRIEFGIDANQDPEGITRAAIREVAAWVRSEDPMGTGPAWANLLEQEASHG